jgi:hypothetical protein
MSLILACPECATRIKLPPAAAGKRVRCPKCGGAIPPCAQQPTAPKPAFEVVDGPDEPAGGADGRGSKTPEPLPEPGTDGKTTGAIPAEGEPTDEEGEDRPRKRRPDDRDGGDRPRKRRRRDEGDDELPEGEREEGREGRRARRRRRRREEEPRRTGPKGRTALLAAGGGVLLLACLVAGVIGAVATLPPSRSADYPKKTASDLMDEWERNPAAASEKYGRGGVEVAGYLREIKSNIHGQTYIEVAESPSSKAWDRSILVYVLSSEARGGLLNCRVGQPVVVKAHSAEGMEDKYPRLIAEDVRAVR